MPGGVANRPIISSGVLALLLGVGVATNQSPCRDTLGIAILTEWSYHEVIMKGITVKLPDTTLRQLRQEARATGRSVAALIRERLEVAPRRRARRSVYEITSDLAGSLAGDRTPATNDRRKFARS